jgi:ribonuclease-3
VSETPPDDSAAALETLPPAPEPGPDYAPLFARIAYTFRDVALLEQALTHKSYVNENAQRARRHWERLEFLGDAVIDLVVGHLMMSLRPDAGEGDLSKLRAAVVSEAGLASVATQLGLGEWVFVGRGEEASGGRRRAGLLADALEALIAAVFLDGGFEEAARVVRHLLAGVEDRLDQLSIIDFKTRLQEVAAAAKLPLRYDLLGSEGPDHDRVFEVAAIVGEVERGRGIGRNKKEAEQRAAEAALASFA